MRYIKTKLNDVANGPGVRVTIFCSGCPHNPKCHGCFNEETHDFNAGELFDDEVMEKLLAQASKSFISGVTLLGGEPMDIRNQEGFLPFVRRFKEENPNKTVWAFTGFDYEDVLKMYKTSSITSQLLPMIDVLVDGKFIEELKDPKLVFRGSSNQRIIMVKESLEKGEIILWQPPKY